MPTRVWAGRDYATRLDHTVFCQHAQLTARQSQFAAENFGVVLADQWCPSGDPPRRAVIDGRLTRVDEAAAELRVFDLFPETAIMQVGVIEKRLRSAHCRPGEAAFLCSVVDVFR